MGNSYSRVVLSVLICPHLNYDPIYDQFLKVFFVRIQMLG